MAMKPKPKFAFPKKGSKGGMAAMLAKYKLKGKK